MAIEQKWWPWKPSLFNQYRIRIANELHLAQCKQHCNELRREISLVEEDINQILQQRKPIDFAQIQEKLNSCISLCQIEQKHALKNYYQVKKQLIHLKPKLLIGNAYLHARNNEDLVLQIQPLNIKKRRKRLKLSIEQQWRKGIGDAYRKLQIQRDKQILIESTNIFIPTEPLPIITDCPLDEPPIIFENIIEHDFLAPLPPPPPPPIDEIIIPFQTPPPPLIACRSPPSDRLQLAVDDTIVKPHRFINKTLGNISHMSFHIEPDQCSSPKTEDKKRKTKLKNVLLPSVPRPPPPLFSSTAIFDTHAFFTQTTNNKMKKQKKKIDISRQPIIMTNNDQTTKKKVRTKKLSPYDFQEEDKSKGIKVITDDIITARFAKNSHYQSHQSSMASIKSSRSNERKRKKKNLLGIGSSSPLTMSTNLTLSPGRLSIDDDFESKSSSSLSKRHNRTKKKQRTRVK